MSKPDIEYAFFGDKRTHCVTLAYRWRRKWGSNYFQIAAAFLRKGDKFCAEAGKGIAFFRLHERGEHYAEEKHSLITLRFNIISDMLSAPHNPLGIPNTPEYRPYRLNAAERRAYERTRCNIDKLLKMTQPYSNARWLKEFWDTYQTDAERFKSAVSQIKRNAETPSDTIVDFSLDNMTLPMLWQLYAKVAIESKADMDALAPIELRITRHLQEEWGACLAHVINAKKLYGYP